MHEFDVASVPLVPGTCALIEANAGTGKTFNIQHLYLRLVLEQELEPSRILVVTFTEAATAELRDRIRQNLAAAQAYLETRSGDEALLRQLVEQALVRQSEEHLRTILRLALAAFDEAAIFTIHGFCKRTLDRNAFEGGVSFDCEFCPSYSQLIRELVRDFYRRERTALDDAGVSLPQLQNHADCILRRIAPLEIEPEDADVEALWADLLETLRCTQPPGRGSKFKDALLAVQTELAQGTLTPHSATLLNPELSGPTAERNAPGLVEAKIRFRDGGVIRALARLRAFLLHPVYGYEARKQRQQTMGYDDLLRSMQAALATGPECPLALELRRSYAVALVDEFQDTDPVQYDIFRTVFKHRDAMFFMIGDPKQAIYGFRGGDIYTYLKAKQDVAAEARFTLARNFRSTRELIDAVNFLFAPAGAFAERGLDYQPSRSGKDPKLSLLLQGEPDTRPFEVVWMSGDADGNAVSKSNLSYAIGRDCVARIADMLQGNRFQFREPEGGLRSVTPGDIAVLVAKNREAETLQQQLLRQRIPAVIYRAGTVFGTEDAKNLWRVLAAMESPNRSERIKAALLSPWCAFTPAALLALNADSEAFAQHTVAFACFRGQWAAKGVLVALAAFMEYYRGMEHIADDPACERRLTNFRHLSELLHQAETEAALEPEALLAWLKQQITDPDCEEEAHEQRMESDRQAVTLMTIHKSKGLQFPVVFIPYLITHDVERSLDRDWTVHAEQDAGDARLVLPVGKAARDGLRKRRMAENLAEDLRILYVAVTRAEHHCVLLMGNVKGRGAKSAVNFLGQLHAGSTSPLSPEAFLDKPPLARNTPPFAASETFCTSTLNADELAACSIAPYQPAQDSVTLEEPQKPPRIEDLWTVMSYSSMVEHDLPAVAAHLKPDAGTDEVPEAESAAAVRDDLPGGKTTGLFVHAVFEQLDFTKVRSPWTPDAEDQALIDDQARSFGLYTDNAVRTEARRTRLKTLVERTLTCPLSDFAAPFQLAEIPRGDTRREWEFFFEVPQGIALAPLKELGLSFRADSGLRTGFMTGSIDLLFRRDGRYYFADWKTDTLGTPDAYAPAGLQQAMIERNYQFQAIVYAVALHALLKQTFGEDYDFERRFGGGFYFFVRGVAEDRGVFAYRPALAELEQWNRVLRGNIKTGS